MFLVSGFNLRKLLEAIAFQARYLACSTVSIVNVKKKKIVLISFKAVITIHNSQRDFFSQVFLSQKRCYSEGKL